MVRPEMPSPVVRALEMLLDAGHEAYVVGGALRDMLLGREAHDWDIATAALPHETESVFSDFSVIKTGLKHGTVTVLLDGMPIEITTFRIDGEYRDARHPEGVRFTSRIEEDLARRDFTVNAMAYNEERGLVDVYGGREDLAAGVIRAVGDAETRFSEDALRILRAFRFMSKLGFDVAEDTLEAAVSCRDGLARISAERITAELIGLFEGKDATRALALMVDNGVFDAIAPDWAVPTFGFSALSLLPPVFELRLAYFLRSCPDRGEGLLKHLRLSGKQSAHIRGLLGLRSFDLSCTSDSCVRRLVGAAGSYADDLVPLLQTGDFFSLPHRLLDQTVERIKAIRARGDCLTVSALAVDGRTLIDLGFSGREIGTVLEKLLASVLEDPSRNTRESLLDLARIIKEKGDER